MTQTVLITGASRGIGLALARVYADHGFDVIASARAPDRASDLAALAAAHPGRVKIIGLDVTDRTAIAALPAQLPASIDILINNAGIMSGSAGYPFWDEKGDPSQTLGSIDPDAWQRVLMTNSIAPLKILEAVIPALRTSKAGRACFMSSVMGSISRADATHIAYCSSKAALNAGMFAAASALKPMGITTVSLHPGWVRTDMGGPEALITPADSAKGLYHVIESLTLADSGQFFSYDGTHLAW